MQNIKIYEGSDEDLVGSNIVINTAGMPWRVVSSRIEKLQENLPLVKEIGEKIVNRCPEAVVITATNPVDPLNVAMQRFTGMRRERLLGYTVNDTARFKSNAAEVLGVESTRVDCTAIGEHGDYSVLLFSTLMVDGQPVTLDDSQREMIYSKQKGYLKAAIGLGTGWTSGWASSVGLASMVAAITGKSDATIPCSFLLKGEYDIDGISMSVPVKLGPQGIQSVVELELTPEERHDLEKGVAYLKDVNREMEKLI